MNLSYDPEGDLLEVIFDEGLHKAEQIPFRLRDGLMLFVTAGSMKPVQLTIVNYLGLSQLPTFYFNGWKKLKATERKKLMPIINSPAVSAFLKLDPKTGYGHLASPPMLEMFSLAA
jgi:hypothetical protein